MSPNSPISTVCDPMLKTGEQGSRWKQWRPLDRGSSLAHQRVERYCSSIQAKRQDMYRNKCRCLVTHYTRCPHSRLQRPVGWANHVAQLEQNHIPVGNWLNLAWTVNESEEEPLLDQICRQLLSQHHLFLRARHHSCAPSCSDTPHSFQGHIFPEVSAPSACTFGCYN